MNLEKIKKASKINANMDALVSVRDLNMKITFEYSTKITEIDNIRHEIWKLESAHRKACAELINKRINAYKEQLIELGVEGISLETEPCSVLFCG